jgi:hypothetical protein
MGEFDVMKKYLVSSNAALSSKIRLKPSLLEILATLRCKIWLNAGYNLVQQFNPLR